LGERRNLYHSHASDGFVFSRAFKGWDFEVFEDGNNGIEIGDGIPTI
jgi:hypothetical protein